jgi:ATP-dependent Clp protease, protease subunit
MMGIELAKINTRFEVFNKAESDEAEIYMYGFISSYAWYEGISSKLVKDKLQSISAKTINVHLHSNGGDVFESIAIYNLLKNHPATIIIHIDGIAGSGASLLAMAANKIIMPKNTMMMIHKGWTYAQGNAAGLRKIADRLDKIDTAVMESYISRFVGEKEELDKLLSDDTYLTADECLALGFADELADDIELPKEEEPKVELSVKDEILMKYSAQAQPVTPAQKVQPQPEPEDITVSNKANILYQFLNSFNQTPSN